MRNDKHDSQSSSENMEAMRKIHQLDLQEIERMKQQLKSSKIFFNMIIHDMRSPTTSLKTGME